jgi:hypothetical protein
MVYKILFDTSFCFAPVGNMVRTDMLFDAIPTKEICVETKCQNVQLLLPIVSKYKCGAIDDVLFDYYYHENSESHRFVKTYELWTRRLDSLFTVKKKTLLSLNIDDDKSIQKKLDDFYYTRYYSVSLNFLRRDEAIKWYRMITEKASLPLKFHILYYIFRLRPIFEIYKIYRILRNK